MQNVKKLALAATVLGAVLIAGGCAGGYNDSYYGNNGHRSDRDRDRDRDREQYWHNHQNRSGDGYDRGDRDDSRQDNSRRVRVCDSDGDNCHWENRGQ